MYREWALKEQEDGVEADEKRGARQEVCRYCQLPLTFEWTQFGSRKMSRIPSSAPSLPLLYISMHTIGHKDPCAHLFVTPKCKLRSAEDTDTDVCSILKATEFSRSSPLFQERKRERDAKKSAHKRGMMMGGRECSSGRQCHIRTRPGIQSQHN